MPSLYFRHPQLSEKLLRSRYQTEYLNKFCKDSKSALHGHRQLPEHVWLEQRPVGSPTFRVDEVSTATYLRPPYASRLTYYDEINKQRRFAKGKEERSRCKTMQPKQYTNDTKASKTSRPASEGNQSIFPAPANGQETINKMTLQKYRERSYENMIGPRVFFRPTIPPHRHDYVIHPAFHSEVKRRPRNVPVRKHPMSMSERRWGLIVYYKRLYFARNYHFSHYGLESE